MKEFPNSERTPTLAEITEIQDRLTKAGFNTGGVDGRVGNDTMKAVRDYQRKVGLEPADGYAGLKVLARLRQGSSAGSDLRRHDLEVLVRGGRMPDFEVARPSCWPAGDALPTRSAARRGLAANVRLRPRRTAASLGMAQRCAPETMNARIDASSRHTVQVQERYAGFAARSMR